MDLDLVFRFAQFYSEFGSLIPFLYDEEKHHPKTLLDIKGRFDEFFKAQGAFCMQMLDIISKGEGFEASYPDGKPLPNPVPNQYGKELMDQLKMEIKTLFKQGVEDIKSALDPGIKNFEAIAEAIKEAMAPAREMYKDERLQKAKAQAKIDGAPEIVIDEIVSCFHKSKFPSIGTLMINLGSSGQLKKLKEMELGNSRASIAYHLKIVRNIFIKKGLIQKPKKKIAESDQDTKPSAVEQPTGKKEKTEKESSFNAKKIPGQEDYDSDNGDSEAEGKIANPSALAEQAETKKLMTTEINKLPQQESIVLHDHYIEGLSLNEISEIRKLEIGSIKEILDRGLKKLKKDPKTRELLD